MKFIGNATTTATPASANVQSQPETTVTPETTAPEQFVYGRVLVDGIEFPRTGEETQSLKANAKGRYALASTLDEQMLASKEAALCGSFEVAIMYSQYLFKTVMSNVWPQLVEEEEVYQAQFELDKSTHYAVQTDSQVAICALVEQMVFYRGIVVEDNRATFGVHQVMEQTIGLQRSIKDVRIYVQNGIKYLQSVGVLEKRIVDGKVPYTAAVRDKLVEIQHELDNRAKGYTVGFNFPLESAKHGFYRKSPRKVIKNGGKATPDLVKVLDTYSSRAYTVRYEMVSAIEIASVELQHRIAENKKKMVEEMNAEVRLELEKELNNAKAQMDALLTHVGKDIYFATQISGAGRVDFVGGLNPQGSSYTKVLLEYSEKLALGESGFETLSQCFTEAIGAEKTLTTTQRRQYADNNRGLWLGLTEFTTETYEEFRVRCEMFGVKRSFAGMRFAVELAQANEQGRKTFKSGMVCHQDLTTSGAQHIAAIYGDRKIAFMSNVVAQSRDTMTNDLYTLACAGHGISDITRAWHMKPAVMTGAFYGAGTATVAKSMVEISHGETLMEDAQHYASTLEGRIATNARALYLHQEIMKPKAYRALACGNKVTFTAPDGYMFRIGRPDWTKKVVVVGKQVCKLERPTKMNARASSLQVSAMSIHMCDSYHLRLICLRGEHIHLTPIHDSFGSHASTFLEVNQIIRSTFAEMHERDEDGHSYWTREFGLNTQAVEYKMNPSTRYEASEALRALNMAN